MAQENWKMMESDEMGCQPPPEGPTSCSNNCGFFGSSTTMNLCSQCYQDALLKQAKVADMAAAISAVRSQPLAEKGTSQYKLMGTEAVVGSSQSEVAESSSEGTLLEQPFRKVNRCLSCNKRVGLTGFKCRCGGLFCSFHRYSDKHDCSFDYKTAAQSSIRKANPVVNADKIDKI